MKIVQIEISKITIPLKYKFSTALRSTDSVNDFLIKIMDINGNVGLGSTTAVTAVTGHTEQEIKNELELFKKCLLNQIVNNTDNIQEIINNINFDISNNTKNAAVMALYDLISHKQHIPLCKLLNSNAECNTPIETSITISLDIPEEMLRHAVYWHTQGFRVIKLKLGSNPIQDLDSVMQINDYLKNHDIEIILDFNQAYNVSQTIAFIDKLNTTKNLVTMIEQPIPKNNLLGLNTIKLNSNLPIIADEACFTIDDLKKIIDANAADGINIKLIKCGGILEAIKMHQLATQADLKIMVGCMLECPIGITAAAHFAAAMENITYTDLDPLALIAHNPINGGAKLVGNKIYLNSTPGLGILE